jgi:cell division protein FtsI (penicillin-binding protein 3)
MAAKNGENPVTGSARVFLVYGLIFFCLGAVLFSLFRVQVLEHSDYVKASQSQSTSTANIPAPRGKIYAHDKDGELYPLAISQWRYQLQVSPRQVKDKSKLAEALGNEIEGLEREAVFAKINNDKVYVPPLIKGLDELQAQKLAKKRYPGVLIKPELTRVYPEGDKIAPQLVGFVGGDGEGQYGIEAAHNLTLRGRGGSTRAKKDSLGRLIDVLSTEQSQPGQDLILTLDYNLQFVVETKLAEAIKTYEADGGSIVVMNPTTGAIMAMAGQPGYDPNVYSDYSGEQFRYLSPAASNVYEAGSVIKPLVMAAAINLGLVEPETTNTFGRSVVVRDREIFNSEQKVYGTETMTQVLENSDNVAMVWVGNLLGTENLHKSFSQFGFGAKTGIDLTGEQVGIMPATQSWNDVLRATASFGHGVSVTTLQLARAYATLANGGMLVTPYLADKTVSRDEVQRLERQPAERVISEEASAKIRGMLVSVVEIGHGKRAAVDGIKVAGKTGTAQVPDPRGGYYSDRHIGTFAGFFPADDPKVVMVVRLDHPKTVRFAEASAAPTFGEIANWMTSYYQLRK